MRVRLPKIPRRQSADAVSPTTTDVPVAIVAQPVQPDDQPTIAYDAVSREPFGPIGSSVPPAAPAVAVPPADLDPAALQLAPAPSFRDRGRLRRRLAYLRRVRELGFRDLGGLTYDLHRFARPGDHLVRAKLDALDVVDRELRALERVLKDEPLYTDLREPGIAACPRCAGLHGSDARFCPSCGLTLDGGPQSLGEIGGLVAGATPAVGPASSDAVSAAQVGSAPVSAAPADEMVSADAAAPEAQPDEAAAVAEPENEAPEAETEPDAEPDIDVQAGLEALPQDEQPPADDSAPELPADDNAPEGAPS